MFGFLTTLLTAILLAGNSTPDIAATIAAFGDGSIGLTYEVRDGVTGNGHGVQVKIGPNSTTSFFSGHYTDLDELREEGPAHITAKVRNGKAVSLDVVVGGFGTQAREADLDLGEVAPAAAFDWLMGIVTEGGRRVAEDAVLGAAIARDVEIAEPFLAVAHDRGHDSDVRSSVLHWLAVLAGERILTDVNTIIEDSDEDVEVREHAVFALTQLDEDEALPYLMDIARNHRIPRLRHSAIFALTQFEDSEEVVAFLEEILNE